MTAVDWGIVAIVSASVLLGVLRGFVRELISVAGWVAGVYLAIRFGAAAGARIPIEIEWPVVKTLLAGILIVAACAFAAALAGWIARQLLVAVQLSIVDRTLGGIFGLARGLLIIAVAVLAALDTRITAQAFWRDSTLLPQLEAGVRSASRHIPVAGRVPG
jgi:membrane protein required for colicin V production